jgi:hypothetical protein
MHFWCFLPSEVLYLFQLDLVLYCRAHYIGMCVSTCRFFLKHRMKCNACWRDLEGQAITTTCGHLLCMTALFYLFLFDPILIVKKLRFICSPPLQCLILIDTSCAGTEDAKKILSNDGACPICDQVLSKSSVVNS